MSGPTLTDPWDEGPGPAAGGGLTRIATALMRFAAAHPLLPHQQAMADEVYAVTEAWMADEITLGDATNLSFDGYIRFKVFTQTAPTHPGYAPTKALIAALAALSDAGGVTSQGFVTAPRSRTGRGATPRLRPRRASRSSPVSFFRWATRSTSRASRCATARSTTPGERERRQRACAPRSHRNRRTTTAGTGREETP